MPFHIITRGAPSVLDEEKVQSLMDTLKVLFFFDTKCCDLTMRPFKD